MRSPGAILLISCYELGHQPLGLASPLGFLEQAGYFPHALDIARTPLLPEAILRAQLVGISVPMHTALRLGTRVAERIREVHPGCHICFYGLYAHLNAGYLLQRHADSIIGGEFEESLVALAHALERGAGAGEVPGVGVAGKPEAPVLRRLRFAPPSRRLLEPLASYASLETEQGTRIAGYVEASRGCLHLCRHCPIPPLYDGRFFVVPREIVLGDIGDQVRSGATHITFGDPDFLNGPGHSLSLLREMHREFPHLTFDFTAKISHLLRYRDLLPELASLGCLFVVSAVESLSDRVLGILLKEHTRSDVERALALVRAAGITLRPSLVPFTPWSTLQDYGDLLHFVDEEDLIDAVDPVQFAVRLLVPPGSRLIEHPAMAPHLGPLEGKSLSHLWTHPDPRMDWLHREVSSLVEKSSHDQEDPFMTVGRIRETFQTLEGDKGTDRLLLPSAHRAGRRSPRLTESWFC